MRRPGEHMSDTWNEPLWRGIGALLSRADDVTGLRMHGLGALASSRLLRTGGSADPALRQDAQAAVATMLLAKPVLERMREATGAALVLIKGPELARLYPDDARTFGDLDILVEDAVRTQRELLASGFQELPDEDGIYVGIHHLPPIVWPALPLKIEVHSRAKWPAGLPAPPTAELVEAAVPSQLADGISTLAPEHHALVVSAHAWAHSPMRSLRDLIDVAAMAEFANDAHVDRLAREWQLTRSWRATRHAIDALFFEGRPPLSLRVWARHLAGVREPTVVENHLQAWISSYWALPPRKALLASGRALLEDARPAHDETWREKLVRAGTAVTHALVPRSEHDRTLGPSAYRGQRRNEPDDVEA